MSKIYCWLYILPLLFLSCKKGGSPAAPDKVATPASYSLSDLTVNGTFSPTLNYYDLNKLPVITITFTAAINKTSIPGNIVLVESSGNSVAFNSVLENNDQTIVITPSAELQPITRYTLNVSTQLLSKTGSKLQSSISVKLITAINQADKFERITDEDLLTLVQRQTFRYFWDFGHPVSGLSRERESSGDLVTTGGSGFGIMSIIVGAHRQFVTRAEALGRLQKITGFLKNNVQRFHGAFPHWLNGATGAVIPFSPKDNGADLVETSFLMQGLLTARQYFNGNDPAETALRADINTLWNEVEWNWFRKNNENVLYWHWSPNYTWEMNHKIEGWNETLVTYVLAASSNTSAIPRSVYDIGWARNGAMRNGNTYFGEQLPLGPALGGPLFFAHYSFLGINPKGLSDAYANYEIQNTAHTLINYNYCKANPKGYAGYGEMCWGLTASDDINGYRVHEPASDNGVISPTAALSSFPYTPNESMAALKFFYYKLGDRIFKEYGFTDAFSLTEPWFAHSFLAIDQGPALIMIENYRSGLLWNLFMSCPEVKTGMKSLGFQSPAL
jgi:hypothetical protein